MDSNKMFLLILAIGAGISLLLVFSDKIDHPVFGYVVHDRSHTLIPKWESRIDTQGVVTIEVRPTELSPKALEWKFDVSLNTHSLELNQNMTKMAVLIDNQGKKYDSLRWDGDAPSGHHRQGVLVFKPINPTPKFVELRIINIDVPVRSFIWNINN